MPDSEGDLHDRALPQLLENAATNPRLAALLDEVERGRTRRTDEAEQIIREHPACKTAPNGTGARCTCDYDYDYANYWLRARGFKAES